MSQHINIKNNLKPQYEVYNRKKTGKHSLLLRIALFVTRVTSIDLLLFLPTYQPNEHRLLIIENPLQVRGTR